VRVERGAPDALKNLADRIFLLMRDPGECGGTCSERVGDAALHLQTSFNIRVHPPVLRSSLGAKEDVIRGERIRYLVRTNSQIPITNYGVNQRRVKDNAPYPRPITN
jgi:hypothetical protein